MLRLRHLRIPLALPLIVVGCSSTDAGGPQWSGTLDTLASGHIVTSNSADPIWTEESGWQLVEELRIGRVDGAGPDAFGNINTFAVDDGGRIWVFDGQGQELRVFGPRGDHIRTLGGSGRGPGEFAQAMRVELGPDGNIWVMDPSNNRLSVFDTAGVYLEGRQALGGFVMFPWPGGFDVLGRYYTPVPITNGEFRVSLVRMDSSFTPVDTLDFPRDPVERDRFELRGDAGRIMAGVPYQGGLVTRLSPAGHLWAMITDQYRLFALSAAGDTLRTITRPYEALPLTDADRDQAREDLEWFVSQGGQVDWTKLPAAKPAAVSFFFDDEGNVWVELVTSQEETGRVFDVFDPDGRYLGPVRSPFPLVTSPAPIIREGVLWAVTRDELEVPYLVRARVRKPARE